MPSSLRFWHSGMLFILLFYNSVKTEKVKFDNPLPPVSFKIQTLDEESSKFQCAAENSNDSFENLQFQWKINGIVQSEVSDTFSVEETKLNEDLRLECLVSNLAGASWAFIDWNKASGIWR